MCVIVDANCFSHVFNQKDSRHISFEPVYNWLFNGHGGALIVGGDKYATEVDLKSSKYRPLIAELARKGRLIEVCRRCVNEIASELKERVQDTDFDDEHIVALVIVSRCHVVCTEEVRAIPFFKNTDLYPHGINPPLIYRTRRNADIVRNAANIAHVCRNKSDMCRRAHEA